MAATPVWVWLPSQDEPVLAGHHESSVNGPARFIYLPEYLDRDDCLALDPVGMRLSRSRRGIALTAAHGLSGVLRDAKPAGYGADRLVAKAARDLTPLELLELGVPDGVGAIEICHDIERKLAWMPKGLNHLKALTEELDAMTPASRAMRRLNDDMDTSAGGERPKATLVHDGRLWLAKMQDRGDRLALPAREFVTMQLAGQVGLDVAEVDLHTFGVHQVLLIARFDRAGRPERPQRLLYASAHTALRLDLDAVQGDPRRSYLNLADALRIWGRGNEDLAEQLQELWRRMVLNALVGNVDDHSGNHGFLRSGATRTGWRLSKAFDITPALSRTAHPIQDGQVLKLATGKDNSVRANKDRLLACAAHFGVNTAEGEKWLVESAGHIAQNWEPMLRRAAGPVVEDAERMDRLIADARQAFAYCEWLAEQT